MDPDRKGEQLLRGRSFLLIQDFCLNSGLDQDTVENLIRAGRLKGSLWTSTEPVRPVAIFSDELPPRETLTAMGLLVHEDYDPDHIRSYAPIGDEGPFGG
jgi:hypothetical protein